MPASSDFLDSNVLCYLFGTDDAKADPAGEFLANRPTISVQVLAEICNVASRKTRRFWAEIEEIIGTWLSSNPFQNYHNGTKAPAYLVWSEREPWPAKTNLVLWQQLLATMPDLVVASRADFAGNLEQLEPVACRMGYRLSETFPGSIPWHGVIVEDETLYFFDREPSQRCITAGCHRQRLPDCEARWTAGTNPKSLLLVSSDGLEAGR